MKTSGVVFVLSHGSRNGTVSSSRRWRGEVEEQEWIVVSVRQRDPRGADRAAPDHDEQPSQNDE